MAKNLKTELKRIGRSGPTVDGRVIEPIALEQAAKNYNKELFTALIWPDHIRWFNMGTVEELRAAANDEGGVDLFAVIAPNDFYLESNNRGQRLFTSMELMPNFRDTGEWYLTGLAATDNPASAATSEMRFTAGVDKAAMMAAFVEATPTHQFDDDTPPGWFSRFVEKFHQSNSPNEDVMKPEQLEALMQQFSALNEKIEKLTAGKKPEGEEKPEEKPNEEFAALSEQVQNLTALVAELKGEPETQGDKNTEDFSALKTDLDKVSEQVTALSAKLEKALNEEHGTETEDFEGDGKDLSTYL